MILCNLLSYISHTYGLFGGISCICSTNSSDSWTSVVNNASLDPTQLMNQTSMATTVSLTARHSSKDPTTSQLRLMNVLVGMMHPKWTLSQNLPKFGAPKKHLVNPLSFKACAHRTQSGEASDEKTCQHRRDGMRNIYSAFSLILSNGNHPNIDSTERNRRLPRRRRERDPGTMTSSMLSKKVGHTSIPCLLHEAGTNRSSALRLHGGRGRAKDDLGGKLCGGNEWIAWCIWVQTGVALDRKQVSSHLQVLKVKMKDNVPCELFAHD